MSSIAINMMGEMDKSRELYSREKITLSDLKENSSGGI